MIKFFSSRDICLFCYFYSDSKRNKTEKKNSRCHKINAGGEDELVEKHLKVTDELMGINKENFHDRVNKLIGSYYFFWE
tara:strand:+ start:2140 stop:2376 length:237 start_codon:yes stop_codon:yes gene_type:complete